MHIEKRQRAGTGHVGDGVVAAPWHNPKLSPRGLWATQPSEPTNRGRRGKNRERERYIYIYMISFQLKAEKTICARADRSLGRTEWGAERIRDR